MKNLRCLLLRQPPLLDDLRNFRDDLCLHQHVFAVGVTQIGINISATFRDCNTSPLPVHRRWPRLPLNSRRAKAATLASRSSSDKDASRFSAIAVSSPTAFFTLSLFFAFAPVVPFFESRVNLNEAIGNKGSKSHMKNNRPVARYLYSRTGATKFPRMLSSAAYEQKSAGHEETRGKGARARRRRAGAPPRPHERFSLYRKESTNF